MNHHSVHRMEDALPSLDGERKVVTVMFADIVRSSNVVTGKDPEDANDHLLPVFRRLQGIVDAAQAVPELPRKDILRPRDLPFWRQLLRSLAQQWQVRWQTRSNKATDVLRPASRLLSARCRQ